MERMQNQFVLGFIIIIDMMRESNDLYIEA